MMKIQILVSTMFQTDYSLLDKINVQSDAVVVNQCNLDNINSFRYKNHNILWINSTERGLSRSRNMALKNSTADVCVICDDDEHLSDGYPHMIQSAYTNLKDADFIVFNINRIGWKIKEKIFIKPEKIGWFKTYSSVHITFKRCQILENDITFDIRFGAGSGIYSCAEDAIFCMDCHKRGLKMYTCPGILCDVVCDNSTWFNGYDEKYFYDVGAYLSVVYPSWKHVMKCYYPVRFRKITDLGAFEIIYAINAGFRGFKQRMSYDEYVEKRNSFS